MESPPKKAEYKVPVSIFEATDRVILQQDAALASAKVHKHNEYDELVVDREKKFKAKSLYQFLF